MPLQPPKRTPDGFHMAIDPAVSTPSSRWNPAAGKWECSPDMAIWLTTQRTILLGELVSHGNWFSRPPRREVLESMFTPWIGSNVSDGSDERQFVCPTPILPEESQTVGCSATWVLEGILMTSKLISPVWSIVDIQNDPAIPSDTISLFEEDIDVDADADAEGREIQFHEIETDVQTVPTKLKTREWEARKFLGKERVREARLKAQIAKRIAKKEESRYYEQFGDPDENESRISDFDLTDTDTDTESGSESVFE